MQRITRKDAKAAGLTHYFTGKPCKRGHTERRCMSNRICLACLREDAVRLRRGRTEEQRQAKREKERKYSKGQISKARRRRYYLRHAERFRKYATDWKKANRARCTDRQSKRHAALLAVFVEDVSLAELFERNNGLCQLCGYPLNLDTKWPHPRTPTRDHIVPLTKGGTHERRNLQLACAECNIRKGNRESLSISGGVCASGRVDAGPRGVRSV